MAQTALQLNDKAAFSSSPSTSYAHYQVFINHRGPDVKKTFASHLYHRLQSIGLPVFLDKRELVEGRTFPSQIEAAIQRAAIHIAIFSPTYAESKWCLDELIQMIKSGATILPVFYKVRPCVLRWTGKDGHGEYAQALRKHEEDGRSDSQTIQNWREALSTAANISGFELQAFQGDEGNLLEKVVERVLNEVDRTPLKFVAEHPTGLKEKLQDFESNVLQEPKKKVVAIVGPGGVGKTTLAKEYFSERRSHYRRSCILYDVRENAVNGSLTSLQRKLLKELTELDLQIDNIHEGIEKLIKHLYLSSSHFLLVLDDVDDARQLEPFWPIKDTVSSNSLILITSRDKKILKTAKITETAVYELKGLNMQHSKELFCRHAFKQPQPLPEFADIVDDFSIACDGLPLSLKLFGALVCGEYDKSYWQEKLNGLKKILPMEIKGRLKISYDSLSSKDQEIFLDIACFFKGEDIDRVIKICGSAWQIRNLENRCLLDVDNENKIKMHDHIRDMGRHIAEDMTPRRLWHQTTNNIDDLLERSSCGNIEVRGVTMDGPSIFDEENTRLLMSEMSWYKRWSHGLFENLMRRLLDNFRFSGFLNLQFVAAEGGHLERIIRRARAPQLKWIRWYKCAHSSLPSWIPMEDLKVLEISGSKLRILWERESQVPHQLRELFICAPLSRFPKSMVQLKHFEKITIYHALFKTLPEELCDVHSLKYLVLRNCSEMISLPGSLEKLTNLQLIDLTNASSLQMLPISFGNLIGLKYLSLRDCPSLTISNETLGNIITLEYLDLKGCSNVKEMPPQVSHQRSLVKLSVSSTMLKSVRGKIIGRLAEMESMILAGDLLPEMFPPVLVCINSMKELCFFDCPKWKNFAHSFELNTQLTGMKLKDLPELKCLPVSLRDLKIEDCSEICSSASVSFLNLLKELKIENYSTTDLLDFCGPLSQRTRLAQCTDDLRLWTDDLRFWIQFRELKKDNRLPDFSGLLTQLTEVKKEICPEVELKRLPDASGLFTELTELWLFNCPELKCLPDSFGLLTQLTTLKIENCPKLKCFPESFGLLRQLTKVCLFNCPELKWLPDSFGWLTQLTELKIRNCPNLQTLLFNGCKGLKQIGSGLPKLEFLCFGECENIKELSSFETLTSLKELHVHGCAKLEKIEGLGQITELRYVHLHDCNEIRELPGVEYSRSSFTVCVTTNVEHSMTFNVSTGVPNSWSLIVCVTNCPNWNYRSGQIGDAGLFCGSHFI